MKIIPARGYVLIEALEADEVSSGGVILAERMKDMPRKGKVLAVGGSIIHFEAGMRDNPEDITRPIVADDKGPCKVGDIVIFKRFVDNKIKEEGKELLLVKFEDILGVYE